MSLLHAILRDFTFLYPFVMSWVWMGGAVWYWFRFERREPLPGAPPELPYYPSIALVVPCYNEEENVRETIRMLAAHDYPNFEIIAVNDGSKDQTGPILEQLTGQYPNLRVLHHIQNQGKASGLCHAALLTSAEYLLCIDGDALLDPKAARWMLRHMLRSPRVGAVTGNPRLRTRSTLLGRLQVGEFSSIIGLIKRAQRTYGRLFTVSGVITCFRKAAVHQVGYWTKNMLTEDIEISWKLQLNHWDVRYEPAALCWILMPETLNGLWKQRLRWAMGGIQVLLAHGRSMLQWRRRRMWVIYIEYCMSVLWAYAVLCSLVLAVFGAVLPDNPYIGNIPLFPQWHGALLGVTAIVQVGLGLAIDRKYDIDSRRHLLASIWYPLAYWLLGTLTTTWAFVKVAVSYKSLKGTWVSPDRGVKAASTNSPSAD